MWTNLQQFSRLCAVLAKGRKILLNIFEHRNISFDSFVLALLFLNKGGMKNKGNANCSMRVEIQPAKEKEAFYDSSVFVVAWEDEDVKSEKFLNF